VEPALELLTEVFPLTDEVRRLDYGEPATYRDGESQSYAQEHETIFRPLAGHYETIRRISSGVMHHIGAIG
jgi:phosphoenolpyruvate carboxylase